MEVTIEPYSPAWAAEFRQTKVSLEKILKDIPICSIEHVGSTSIPGLAAKPVLDINIIVTSETLPSVRAALVSAGYFYCGEMNVPGRFAFRQPGYGQKEAAWGHSDGEMRRNTYAMIEGCVALKNHMDIKRVLTNDEDLREEYGRVKKQLEEREFTNIGEYVMAKNEILWKILVAAGWNAEDLEELRKANS